MMRNRKLGVTAPNATQFTDNKFGHTSIELLWQIKDGHQFSDLSSIQRGNLFILPLKLGWLVTALNKSIWQNDVIQSQMLGRGLGASFLPSCKPASKLEDFLEPTMLYES